MLEHGGSQWRDEGQCLGMKVPKHCIRTPAANQPDNVGVNVATEKGHSPAGTKTATGDVPRLQIEVGQRGY